MQVKALVAGARRVSQDFEKASVKAKARSNAAVRHYGHLLATKVKAKASGRPGPNAPTGDYRRSISVQFEGGPTGSYTAIVGTNAVQGRRLEFGFHGRDSLGRFYDQPPYPHFGPAVDEIEPEFLKELEKAAKL